MFNNNNIPSSSSDPLSSSENGCGGGYKRKRRPAGTPDPDAEVVSLSPKTLLESDRYVCEICNQGFQRDQNLQMHRRRHKVPWKLLKRETPVVKKRVFVCPEPTCLHHDPCHALGDLVGIKKHFRRKHTDHRQWVCGKCSKGYAVQSDYKAHLKTCGTRGHSCDCGRVFSRVESFIEHQDACKIGQQQRPESHLMQPPAPACLSRTASSPTPSSETNLTPRPPKLITINATFSPPQCDPNPTPTSKCQQNLELRLQLISPSSLNTSQPINEEHSTQLQLSIGSSHYNEKNEEQDREKVRAAMAEKAYADEARQQAKREIEMANQEFLKAKRIRQQAQEELSKAQALREHVMKQMQSTILHVTCQSCKNKFHARESTSTGERNDDKSLEFISYMSSSLSNGESQKFDTKIYHRFLCGRYQ
ncbi:hypothetical protein LIER_19326 [Lithospermum erythrorhizon]|uniref:C2H2-type domain-containing protein n=1 Tax=Lithospermum erythrorhizon TaxID=34254 RepID=A0AAV3QIU2_LITER